MEIFLDANRYTYLQYKDNGKTRNYVSMVNGSIDCIQLHQSEFRRLKRYTRKSVEHFARVYLNSHLAISRSARAILRGILGYTMDSEPQNGPLGGPRSSSGMVPLEEILEGSWNPSMARKFLRKNVEKPGGRWAWEPEEAEVIRAMLKEFFHADNT